MTRTGGTSRLGELGEALRRGGLTPRLVRAFAGSDHLPIVAALAARATSGASRPLATASPMLALFVLGHELPRAGLAMVDDLVREELVEASPSSVRAKLAVVPAGPSLVVCDRLDAPAHDELVCWPDDSSYHLAHALPPGRRSSWLDLGTGSAFAPLVRPAVASAIVGADLNPRAVAYARLGVALSGIGHIAIRGGDIADAPAERFALVTCNAPIPAERGPMWRATDAGFVERLIAAAARAVAPGGLVVVHAALDALLAEPIPGDAVIVAYTPAGTPREFAILWWQPDGEPRQIRARRALDPERPHLDHTDREAAAAGTLPHL